ncbi:MAG: hypothetical protein ACE5HO_01600 [bacterium]
MTKIKKYRLLALLSILTLLLFLAGLAHAQTAGISVDQSLVQSVTVKNKRLVKFFTEDFMIPEKQVAWLKIYDLSGDGFGNGDLARTFPGGKIYLITPGEKAQSLMNKWSFGGNIKFTANSTDSPALFEQAPDSVRAMGGIFAALLKGLRRNYKGLPIKLFLEQNDNVTAVQMWGYNPQLMQYQPAPVAKMPVEKPVMKLIYLEKTVVDSVLYTPK